MKKIRPFCQLHSVNSTFLYVENVVVKGFYAVKPYGKVELLLDVLHYVTEKSDGCLFLFQAKICPSRPANSLTGCEWGRLSAVIPECMAFFIEKNTIEEYLETKGQDYRKALFLQVYGHDGEACPVCGEILCRTVIGGRSSVYCPGCQRNL